MPASNASSSILPQRTVQALGTASLGQYCRKMPIVSINKRGPFLGEMAIVSASLLKRPFVAPVPVETGVVMTSTFNFEENRWLYSLAKPQWQMSEREEAVCGWNSQNLCLAPESGKVTAKVLGFVGRAPLVGFGMRRTIEYFSAAMTPGTDQRYIDLSEAAEAREAGGFPSLSQFAAQLGINGADDTGPAISKARLMLDICRRLAFEGRMPRESVFAARHPLAEDPQGTFFDIEGLNCEFIPVGSPEPEDVIRLFERLMLSSLEKMFSRTICTEEERTLRSLFLGIDRIRSETTGSPHLEALIPILRTYFGRDDLAEQKAELIKGMIKRGSPASQIKWEISQNYMRNIYPGRGNRPNANDLKECAKIAFLLPLHKLLTFGCIEECVEHLEDFFDHNNRDFALELQQSDNLVRAFRSLEQCGQIRGVQMCFPDQRLAKMRDFAQNYVFQGEKAVIATRNKARAVRLCEALSDRGMTVATFYFRNRRQTISDHELAQKARVLTSFQDGRAGLLICAEEDLKELGHLSAGKILFEAVERPATAIAQISRNLPWDVRVFFLAGDNYSELEAFRALKQAAQIIRRPRYIADQRLPYRDD